jgi:hypothetical protein
MYDYDFFPFDAFYASYFVLLPAHLLWMGTLRFGGSLGFSGPV